MAPRVCFVGGSLCRQLHWLPLIQPAACRLQQEALAEAQGPALAQAQAHAQ